jgi:O-antigen/teichoic acid export membrane protein
LVPFVSHLRLEAEGEPGEVNVLAELGALAGAMALAQVLVQFPPAFAEWLGESPEVVSAIFATFSLGRAPLLVILAVSARLTDPLTRFMSGPVDQVRRTLARTMWVTAAAVAIAGLLGYLIGPQLVTWFFGPGRALGAGETAMISAGLALASAGVVVTLGLMVKGSNRLAAVYWLVALIIAVVSALLGIGVPMSFLIAELLAVALSATTLWSQAIRPQLSAGSPL